MSLMQRAFFFLFALLSAATSLAENGVIWTLDGRRLEGDIAFAHDSFIINSSQGGGVTLPVTNLARAEFSAAPGAATGKGSGNGLLGIYYNTTNCTGATVMRLDAAINFDWRGNAPILGIPKDFFSVRWMGQIAAPTSESYTIYFGSDDGGRIYFDDQLMADHWSRHDYAETNVTVNLKAGEKHKLKLEYYDLVGNARGRLSWSTAAMPKTIIPPDRLSAASFDVEHQADSSGLAGSQGLLATYYNSEDFASNSFTRIDPEINFDWQGEAPAPGIATNHFSVRWSGNLLVTNSGEYKFYILGGEPARLFINNQLLSDPSNVTPQQIIPVRLDAARPCELRLEARITTNLMPVRLYWSGEAFPQSLVSRQNLSAVAPVAVDEPPKDRGPKFPAGVFLLNGTIVAAPIQSANESSIRFRGVLAKQPLPLTKVARIYLKPLSPDLAAALPKGRAGVLLNNGDFIDGDLTEIENGRLKLGSVLFGNRSYDLVKEVLAIVLRGPDPRAWTCSIAARDGTVLYGPSISVEPARIGIGRSAEFFIAPADVLAVTCPSESTARR